MKKQSAACFISDLRDRNEVLVKLLLPNIPARLQGLRSIPDRETSGLAKNLAPNGEQVLHNAQMVGIRKLWPAFVGEGFHFFEAFKEARGSEGLAVSLSFVPLEEGDEVAKLPSESLMAINDLLSTVWQYCHAFENPDRNLSIVAISPRFKVEPLRAFVVEDSQLGILTLPQNVRIYSDSQKERIAS